MTAKYRTRVCAACGQRRPMEAMARCATVSRWRCAACPEPGRAGPSATGKTCPLCDRKAHSNGLCHTHEMRWRRWGKPPLQEWIAAFQECRLCTCAVCGAGFNGHKGSVVCCNACKEELGRRRILEHWRSLDEAGKQRWALRSTAYNRAKRARRKVHKQCLICQTPIHVFPEDVLCNRPGCRSRYATLRTSEFRQRQAEEQINDIARKLGESHG